MPLGAHRPYPPPMDGDAHTVTVPLPTYSTDGGMTLAWVDGYRLRVRVLGSMEQGFEVVIEGNAEGFESLGRYALALAQTDVPSGFHLHMEDSTVLDAPSSSLVLDREDDLSEYDV